MLSLRVKFTIYYLAILTVVLLFFGIAIYAYLSHTLLMTVDESLDYQVRKIERNMAAGAGAAGAGAAGAVGNGAAGTATDVIQLNSEDEEMLQLAPHITQLIDEEGRITDPGLSEESHQLPVDRTALLELPVGQTVFESVKLKSGEPLRLATRRAINHDDGGNGAAKGTYFIRLGQSVKSLTMARRRLLLLLLVALPTALLWGSYGGLVLINQAMRPVDRITRAAEHIGAGDLTERVPVPGLVPGRPEKPKRMDEIGRLAVTFNQMIARLQSAFERQKQFTSDASHELRTPLAVMRGEIEITLRRERPVEEYQRVLTSNLEEIVRLSRLVEDLLMLARADTGRVELQCDRMDLDALCRQMTDYISPLAEQRHQTLSYETSQQLVMISADSQRLKQLLLNLLDNAIKYTDPGGTIKFSLKADGGNAVMMIADTGRGIPREDLPHIFERFFRRSAKTADRAASGFGLGLSIVKWIVDSHGGQIEAQSEVGTGTVFTVKFPLL